MSVYDPIHTSLSQHSQHNSLPIIPLIRPTSWSGQVIKQRTSSVWTSVYPNGTDTPRTSTTSLIGMVGLWQAPLAMHPSTTIWASNKADAMTLSLSATCWSTSSRALSLGKDSRRRTHRRSTDWSWRRNNRCPSLSCARDALASSLSS